MPVFLSPFFLPFGHLYLALYLGAYLNGIEEPTLFRFCHFSFRLIRESAHGKYLTHAPLRRKIAPIKGNEGTSNPQRFGLREPLFGANAASVQQVKNSPEPPFERFAYAGMCNGAHA